MGHGDRASNYVEQLVLGKIGVEKRWLWLWGFDGGGAFITRVNGDVEEMPAVHFAIHGVNTEQARLVGVDGNGKPTEPERYSQPDSFDVGFFTGPASEEGITGLGFG